MRWPTTVDEALLLPPQYGVKQATLEFLIRFMGEDEQTKAQVIQAYVAHRYNGFYIPAMSNIFLWRFVASAIALTLLCRFLASLKLPRPLRSAFYTLETCLLLSPLWGTSIAEPKRLLGGRLGAWSSFQVPTRIDGVILTAYLSASFYLTFFHYHFVTPNIFFPDPEGSFPIRQYLRYIGDRTAIFSFGSTPLVILLAARNSPLSWLTGASFARLQIYHRWVSRVTFGAVLIHALAYITLILGNDGLSALFGKVYLRWGWVAFAGGNILCITSWRRLREIAYEVFVVGHILGALAWIIGAYYHVAHLHAQRDHLWWIYLATFVWAFDRVLRLTSLLYNNTPLHLIQLPQFINKRFSTSSTIFLRDYAPSPSPFAEAEGTIVEDGQFVRLRITPARKWPTWKGRPGTHVFVSIPGARGWESHPFSIAWPLDVPLPRPNSSASSSFASSSTIDVAEDLDEDVATPEAFELVVKACDGFTGRLRRGLEGDVEGGGLDSHSLKLIVEGPYGSIHTFEQERWVLLVAGGSGIAATISHLADMAKQTLRSKLRTERVVVVWSIRMVETVSLLLPYLLRLRPLLADLDRRSSPFIDLHIYLTRPCASSTTPKPALTAHDILTPALDAGEPFLALTTHLGRPQVGQHIDELLNIASVQGGRVAVSACGPLGLCDRTREAVRERLGEDGIDGDRLMYKEEGGTW